MRMAHRVLLALAISSFASTTVLSYGFPGFSTGESGLIRQIRRCPTCPADCPESLSSQWYESPKVYGHPVPIKPNNNRDFDQQCSSFSGHRNFRRETPNSRSRYNAPTLIDANSYDNPLSGESNFYDNSYINFRSPCANCNARPARSDGISSIPNTFSFDPRSFPYDLLTNPDRYRESANSFGTSLESPNEARRVSRHYGNSYDDLRIGNDFERSRSTGSPAQKKVYVVYRADVKPSSESEEDDAMSFVTSANENQRSLQASSGEESDPMSDSQLEEVVRRAIAAATKQSRQEDALYQSPGDVLREVDYNEHNRGGDETFYNPRRPYNDELHQRFNPETPIDWHESSKKISGYRPFEMSYTPFDSFYTDAEHLDTNIPNFSREEEFASEDTTQDDEAIEPEVARWGENTGSNEEEDVEMKQSESGSEEERESKEFDETTAETIGEKSSEETEVTLPLTNYRTHSRSDEEMSSENEERGAIEETTIIPSTMEEDNVEQISGEVSSDELIMEIEDPTIATESMLRFNFEPPKTSTSSLIN